MNGPSLLYKQNTEINRQATLVILFIFQVLVLLVSAGLITCYRSSWTLSFSAGCAIHILPALYFGWCVLKDSSTATTQEIVKNFYRGESTKFFLTALGFALAFKTVKPLYGPALFAGYGLMLAVHTLAAAWISRKSHFE